LLAAIRKHIASATRADADLSGAALKVEPPSRLTNRYRARAERCALCRIVVQGEPDTERHGPRFSISRDSTMNGHGGKRPGAGRPRGAASRANEEVRQEAAATGELPPRRREA
jgi:hypothetical protein